MPRRSLFKLLSPGGTADAETQLPTEQGEGGGLEGELLPLEEELFCDRLHLAMLGDERGKPPGSPSKDAPSRKGSTAGRKGSTATKGRKGSLSPTNLADLPLPLQTLPAPWAVLLARSKKLLPDVWPLPRLLQTIAQIYYDKLEAEDVEENDAVEITPWPDFVLAWFVRSTGLRSKAIARLNGLLYSVRFYAAKSVRAGTFGEACGMEEPYAEQHVARLLRVLSVCIPRPQLVRLFTSSEVQWVQLTAAKGKKDVKDLAFETMVDALFADASLAKERVALMDAFEKEATDQASSQAADGSTEPVAMVNAEGAARLKLDDAVKLLVRAVDAAEESEDFELRLAFQQALASDGSQMKAGKDGGPAKGGVLSHTRFMEMVLKIDPSKKAREIDAYFFEALTLSDLHEYSDGAGMPLVSDAIGEDAWLSVANLHGLRVNVIQYVRPLRRSSSGYQRGAET